MIRKALATVGLVALATGPALATAAPATAAPAATTAAKPGYVAIVISGHGTYCVKWTSGITGDTVLNKVAQVGYRNDGLIVTIDGDPSSGTADDTHYWSYWHDTTSSWTYSSAGASSYDPPAGSVEGWSYDNGQADPPPPSQNPSGLYTSLCGRYDAATTGGGGGAGAGGGRATSAPATKHTAAARTSGPRGSVARTSTVRHASRAPRSSTRSSASPTSPAATSTPATGPRASSSSPDVIAVPAGGSSTAPGSISASAAASTSSSGSPTGLIVGIGLVVVLGAGAGALALRRRGAGG